MSPQTLSELLKLPAGERAELAMALWESLSAPEREAGLTSDLLSSNVSLPAVKGRASGAPESFR